MSCGGTIEAQGDGCYPSIAPLGCCDNFILMPTEWPRFRVESTWGSANPFLSGSGGGGHQALIGGDAVTIPEPGPVPQLWTQHGMGFYNGYGGFGGGFVGGGKAGNPHGGAIGSTGPFSID